MKKQKTVRPDETDTLVGTRMRERRVMLGMSQMSLADQIGVTFQQIQKYEKGINRVSAGCLWKLSKSLDAPLDFFFTGKTKAPKHKSADDREVLEIVRAFKAIPAGEMRRSALNVIRAFKPGA